MQLVEVGATPEMLVTLAAIALASSRVKVLLEPKPPLTPPELVEPGRTVIRLAPRELLIFSKYWLSAFTHRHQNNHRGDADDYTQDGQKTSQFMSY